MTLLTAIYSFMCPQCGTRVKRGETFVRSDDTDTCTKCGLPARRLIPKIQFHGQR